MNLEMAYWPLFHNSKVLHVITHCPAFNNIQLYVHYVVETSVTSSTLNDALNIEYLIIADRQFNKELILETRV